uniref:hypothetical protein n=1 Tax=Vibrio harveyi TaxID=669 RepID=UPI00068198BE|nr:hypothetical protein [Vibrio harveyi]
MNNHRLTAAESHELACRVSALGAKQVLELLRVLQNKAFDHENKTQPSQVRSIHAREYHEQSKH